MNLIKKHRIYKFIEQLDQAIRYYNESSLNYKLTQTVSKNVRSFSFKDRLTRELILNLTLIKPPKEKTSPFEVFYNINKRIKIPTQFDISCIELDYLEFDKEGLKSYLESGYVDKCNLIRDDDKGMYTLSVSRGTSIVTQEFELDFIKPVFKINARMVDYNQQIEQLNTIVQNQNLFRSFLEKYNSVYLQWMTPEE